MIQDSPDLTSLIHTYGGGIPVHQRNTNHDDAYSRLGPVPYPLCPVGLLRKQRTEAIITIIV